MKKIIVLLRKIRLKSMRIIKDDLKKLGVS